MNSDEVLGILRKFETALRERGVAHAPLFGSLARGDHRPDSDIDIAIEIDPTVAITIYDYVAIKKYIAGLFTSPVDVVDRSCLKPYVRISALPDMIDAF